MYCVYRITNTINGKTYIGQHKYTDESNPMKGYFGSGKILHQAYEKYGKESFNIEVLYKRIVSQETVNSIEQFAIKKERMLGKAEYNIAKGGDCGYHKLPSSKTKELISESLKAYFKTDKGIAQVKASKAKQSEYAKKHYKYTDAMAEDRKKRRKRVLCVETGIIYDSIAIAESSVPHCGHKIGAVLKGLRERAGGFHWRLADEL